MKLTKDDIEYVEKFLSNPKIQQSIANQRLDFIGEWDEAKAKVIQYLYDNGYNLLEWKNASGRQITEIPFKFFAYITLNERLDVPSNIVNVRQGAFWNADIKTINFRACSELTELPGFLFSGNNCKVKNVALPPNLTIMDRTFSYRKNINKIDAPDDIVLFLSNNSINIKITPNNPDYVEWVVKHIALKRLG